jgi:hypothetical protein
MNDTWVLSIFCCAVAPDAIVCATPRVKTAIEPLLFRSGTHRTAPWHSTAADSCEVLQRDLHLYGVPENMDKEA